ncbi:hypothetical protein [Arthrobacter sp. JSM 101049]|uniref:hypothetical protein n=1 Tax=Arthrobacter sp. JSM 101049 TaxID=929097 RepID=UPI00356802C3
MPSHHFSRNDPLPRLRSALRSGEVSLQDVWIACVGLGGEADAFTLDAYLHGVGTLSPLDHLVLECACRDALDV